ncbi:uncharacterized protein TNCT_540441 [Trichonephila clavata]|uniref:Uncharacterized protein n=1 Tax=Trichonephila clavata TaxID=2740835 RepID=A0A8X6L1M3_TRICU|nr:uncharacterized protein TNCT_540441 [Trichonephila clavata]
MIDGKFFSWLSHSSSQNCHLCLEKPSSMNGLEAMKTRQIVAENVKLGISSLHTSIKCFECILRISYRLGIKKWSVRRADRPVVDARKKEVQEKFRRQMGLLLNAPKPSFRTSNDGNTARAFFRNPEIAFIQSQGLIKF